MATKKNDHQSGTITNPLPKPVILAGDNKTPPLDSPVHPRHRLFKRRKGARRDPLKHEYSMKKAQNLTDSLNPIPFIPTKTLDFDKHNEVLKRLGLWDFSKIEFDSSIRTDLARLIVSYDPKKRCSYVNDLRVPVNRSDLARALKLPLKNVDSKVFSDESIGFIEDFVSNCVLLHEDSWVMPTEIKNWTGCIKDGHPEKMDSASLIWYMVEKELNQGDKLVNCYYASHLQCLIRSQREVLFMAAEVVTETKAEENCGKNARDDDFEIVVDNYGDKFEKFALELGKTGNNVFVEFPVAEALDIVPGAKKMELKRKWKEFNVLKVELYLRGIELIRETMEAAKSSPLYPPTR